MKDKEDNKGTTCDFCNGEGTVFNEVILDYIVCPKCKGKGVLPTWEEGKKPPSNLAILLD